VDCKAGGCDSYQSCRRADLPIIDRHMGVQIPHVLGNSHGPLLYRIILQGILSILIKQERCIKGNLFDADDEQRKQL